MTVQLKPETEQLVLEELSRGHFHSMEHLIVECVRAWREKHQVESIPAPPQPRKRLYDLLTQLPFAGSELNLDTQKDYPRPVDL